MNTNVKILESHLTKEEIKQNLQTLCNTIIRIASQQKERGIDVSKCFIEQKEYERLKKENPNNFL